MTDWLWLLALAAINLVELLELFKVTMHLTELQCLRLWGHLQHYLELQLLGKLDTKVLLMRH